MIKERLKNMLREVQIGSTKSSSGQQGGENSVELMTLSHRILT